MKTIVISGSHSNIGKTSLIEEMLRSLKGWSALKVTVKHARRNPSSTINEKSRCPRQKSCGVCSEIKRDYTIVKDKKIINQSETDTARMRKAGASRVIWLKASIENLKNGLSKALDKLKDTEGVIIEGNSAMRYIKPDLAIYLKDHNFRVKPSAKYAAQKADIIINVGKKSGNCSKTQGSIV